jgi:exopolysaccharide biosynthesis polyprenyl glycosylphosphotransferase
MLLPTAESRRARKRLRPPRTRHGVTWVRAAATGVLAAAAAYALAGSSGPRIGQAFVVCLVVAWTQRSVARHLAPHARFLPFMRVATPVAAPALAFVILAILEIAGLLPLSLGMVALVCVVGALGTAVAVRLPREPSRPPLRIGIVGSAATTADLRSELATQIDSSVRVVGHIATEDDHGPGFSDEVRTAPIGRLGELASSVVRHRLDLLLVSSSVPRMGFFNEMEATCSHLEVRVLELSAYYEHTFGHVPLRAINAAWFQWVMHPRYSPRTPLAKRIVDLGAASLLAFFAAPVVAVLALLVKRDGGPALYRQQRVGEGGRTFEVLKLRSMGVAEQGAAARWSSADDERITPIGRFMRRTHLDELPQLINVLRGDMSLVGPRPEQPAFVEELEETVPFYSRRNVVRPGITGWAQVRCGYAGSHEGTLWKLSHDLYYLKHRSVTFDLLILGETLRTAIADSQFPTELYLPPFVHRVGDSHPPTHAQRVAARSQ